MRHKLVFLVVLFLAAWQGGLARDVEHGVSVQSNVMIAMRDGVQLATDIYLPAKDAKVAAGRFPVILTRTPYGKSGGATFGKYFAAQGYVFVAQDTRGRYTSEGVWHWMTDDGRDGADCAAWIAQQPWSDGKIGMVGTSYAGGTQHAMATDDLGDGIVRARFRDSLEAEKLMTPGVVYPVTVKLYPTSNVFKKGHRIRVDTSSSNFPRFDVNPNTGEPLNDQRTSVSATNTIHHDAAHPSHIILPVIPKS